MNIKLDDVCSRCHKWINCHDVNNAKYEVVNVSPGDSLGRIRAQAGVRGCEGMTGCVQDVLTSPHLLVQKVQTNLISVIRV